VSLDAHGIDMMSGERIERLEFDAPLSNAAQLREVLVDLAARARAIPPGAG
jgi:putative heme iron utilization protein